LLFVGELKPAQKDRVKLAAKHLLTKLKDNATKKQVFTPDWHKNP
jgi:type I restriction enzyme R subunit